MALQHQLHGKDRIEFALNPVPRPLNRRNEVIRAAGLLLSKPVFRRETIVTVIDHTGNLNFQGAKGTDQCHLVEPLGQLVMDTRVFRHTYLARLITWREAL